MELEKWQIQKFIPMQNWVLTTSVYRTDVVKLGDVELYQDTHYNPSAHIPIVQRVVSVPKSLVYGREQTFIELDKGYSEKLKHNLTETFARNSPLPHSMPWKVTDIDLKKDDTVWVDAFIIGTAEQENRVFTCEGTTYTLVKYEDIYFKLVDGKPLMLNGWCMVEPIDNPEDDLVKNLKKVGFIFPGITVTNENRKEVGKGDKLAIVRHIGLPVESYLEDELEEVDEISVGDTILLKWSANRRLESPAHRFFSQTELIVTRRPRVVAILKDSLFN